MKIAIVNTERHEPLPDLAGSCPACGAPMISKCGTVKVWHWAHRATRHCDPWWENETEWHRAWKAEFPIQWQEIIHTAPTGEKHIADVKTDSGWVIEFQHSYLKAPERAAREAFYTKLIWVVDGLRRKRDANHIINAWQYGAPIGQNSQIKGVPIDGSALLRDWSVSKTPVFFDLGDSKVIWWKISSGKSGAAYLFPYSRDKFLNVQKGTDPEATRQFENFVFSIPTLVTNFENPTPEKAPEPIRNQIPPERRHPFASITRRNFRF